MDKHESPNVLQRCIKKARPPPHPAQRALDPESRDLGDALPDVGQSPYQLAPKTAIVTFEKDGMLAVDVGAELCAAAVVAAVNGTDSHRTSRLAYTCFGARIASPLARSGGQVPMHSMICRSALPTVDIS